MDEEDRQRQEANLLAVVVLQEGLASYRLWISIFYTAALAAAFLVIQTEKLWLSWIVLTFLLFAYHYYRGHQQLKADLYEGVLKL